MFTDFVLNGELHGPMAGILEGLNTRNVRFEPGLIRPYFNEDDGMRPTVSIQTGRMVVNAETGDREPEMEEVRINDLIVNFGIQSPVFNATALRKEEWIQMDTVVLRASRYRLKAWQDLLTANPYGGFNGMAKMILEHETMSDPGMAVADMDGLTEGQNDAPKFQLEGLPLPITHSDFWFSSRKLAISRNSGTPIDTTMGEAAGRRVAETVERTTIGNQTGVTYGGNSTQTGGYGRTSQVYGYINFPSRLTKTNFTAPTAGGWTPETTQREFNVALNLLRVNKFFGPFMVYHSNDWDPYFDGDYYALATSGMAAPSQTLRNRLKQIDGIQDVRRLDMLFDTAPQTDPYFTSSTVGTTGLPIFRGPGGENLVNAAGTVLTPGQSASPFTLIFVQMTPDVARAVNGMDITTVQWESMGGMRLNFKVMCIQVPQLRADFYGNCGILHGTTA